MRQLPLDFRRPVPQAPPTPPAAVLPRDCPYCPHEFLAYHMVGLGCLAVIGWDAEGGPVLCSCVQGEV